MKHVERLRVTTVITLLLSWSVFILEKTYRFPYHFHDFHRCPYGFPCDFHVISLESTTEGPVRSAPAPARHPSHGRPSFRPRGEEPLPLHLAVALQSWPRRVLVFYSEKSLDWAFKVECAMLKRVRWRLWFVFSGLVSFETGPSKIASFAVCQALKYDFFPKHVETFDIFAL